MYELDALKMTPLPSARSNRRSRLRSSAGILTLAVGILILDAVYGRLRFGSISVACAYIRGERLLVEDPIKFVRGVPDGLVEISYSLVNWTGRPVGLIGVDASCSCTSVTNIPMTLAASEAKVVTVIINTSELVGDLHGTIRLFTDDAGHPEVKLAYVVHASFAHANLNK